MTYNDRQTFLESKLTFKNILETGYCNCTLLLIIDGLDRLSVSSSSTRLLTACASLCTLSIAQVLELSDHIERDFVAGRRMLFLAPGFFIYILMFRSACFEVAVAFAYGGNSLKKKLLILKIL